MCLKIYRDLYSILECKPSCTNNSSQSLWCSFSLSDTSERLYLLSQSALFCPQVPSSLSISLVRIHLSDRCPHACYREARGCAAAVHHLRCEFVIWNLPKFPSPPCSKKPSLMTVSITLEKPLTISQTWPLFLENCSFLRVEENSVCTHICMLSAACCSACRASETDLKHSETRQLMLLIKVQVTAPQDTVHTADWGQKKAQQSSKTRYLVVS